jgi:hypothetical protein
MPGNGPFTVMRASLAMTAAGMTAAGMTAAGMTAAGMTGGSLACHDGLTTTGT